LEVVALSSPTLYDKFSQNYDLFISWESRLEDETPFFEEVFAENGVESVLDVGCGTGVHSIMFARWGLTVAGADVSQPMIDRAKRNADEARVKVRFVKANFEQLGNKFKKPFDAITCLGNSLPHVLTDRELTATMESFASVLRPGGVLVIHNLNYDRLAGLKQRFLNPKHAHRDGRDFIFLRFFDFPCRYNTDPLQLWTFNVVTLMREDKQWRLHMDATEHRPLRHRELREFVSAAGFGSVRAYGNYQQERFRKDSDLLLMVAKKKG